MINLCMEKDWQLENITPMQVNCIEQINVDPPLLISLFHVNAFLTQHVLHSARIYQARIGVKIWVNLITTQNLPKPNNFGLRRDGSLSNPNLVIILPCWFTLINLEVIQAVNLAFCSKKHFLITDINAKFDIPN